jgi:uncharacterized protein (TIGR02996 family)
MLPYTARSLIAAVWHAPHDRAPRLILADWFQEHGDEVGAAFWRVPIRVTPPPLPWEWPLPCERWPAAWTRAGRR